MTYTAVPATNGFNAGDHTISWDFDDATSGTGSTYLKTWAASGEHTATATALNTTTGGTASAQKTITVKDWANDFTWTSTGLKIIPAASATFGLLTSHCSHRLFVSGTKIINLFDYYTPGSVVVYDTDTHTRTEYTPDFSVIGSPDAGYLLDSGPNSGSIVVVGKLTGRYGFLNPSTGVFSTSPNSMPYVVEGATAHRSPIAKMGNNKLFLHGYKNGPSFRCMVYDQELDSWTAASGTGSSIGMGDLFSLPSGNLLGVNSVTSDSWIYNYQSNTWSSGPTLPFVFASESHAYTQGTDGRIYVVTGGTTCVMSTWGEGEATFVSKTSIYPYLSQNAVATNGNSRQSLVVTPDGFMVNVGGNVSSGVALSNTKTVFYGGLANDVWTVGVSLITGGVTYRAAFCNGRLWRATLSGILEYSSIW